MRISVKGRYALAAMIVVAEGDHGNHGENCVTAARVSERLGLSKIYLEQVFSLLKKGGLVHSVKGAQGGYRPARPAREITAFDILSSSEASLFEKTEDLSDEAGSSGQRGAPNDAFAVNTVMGRSVFDPLDEAVRGVLTKITLGDLVRETEKHASGGLMFYI